MMPGTMTPAVASCGAPGARQATSTPNRYRAAPPDAVNHVWAYDFVFDTCANGQSLKCLTVIDEWSRECLALRVAGSMRSARVIETLKQLVSLHGAPRYLRSDSGPEFVSRAILRLITDEGMNDALNDPGKRWQTGGGTNPSTANYATSA